MHQVVVYVNGEKGATPPARAVSLWVTENSTPLSLYLSFCAVVPCISLCVAAALLFPPPSLFAKGALVMCRGAQNSRHEVHCKESKGCQEQQRGAPHHAPTTIGHLSVKGIQQRRYSLLQRRGIVS